MTILYHMTNAPPRIPGTDAVDQDVAALEGRFGGSSVRLNPFRSRGPLWRLDAFAGLHLLPKLLRMDREVELHHVFGGAVRYYRVHRMLERPIVYTAVAGLEGTRPSRHMRHLPRAIVVASERSVRFLRKRGFGNVVLIPPGIDTDRLTQQPLPLQSDFVLLAGSAPWVPEQFSSKGFDVLFAAVARRANVRLVLLWRGLLERELLVRLDRHGLRDRVEIVNRHVNVNELLGRIHAAVVLAEQAHLIKEYPHSLIEALVVGRPVMVSQCIAMADYVRSKDCGVVVEHLTEEGVGNALDRLSADYERYRQRAVQNARQDFSLGSMLDAYQQVYESCGYRGRGTGESSADAA